jgi:monofunctional biosynthetic peptidoglycan transglycosylase
VRIAEDDRFFMHNGFDFTEIRNAMETNLREKKWVRGASTISQQLAKNLYLSSEKTLTRKFDEMLLTWKLEQALTKERILEIYLNVVDWGNGCFGAEAASRFYFSKPSSRLSAREAANLAARLPNPHYLGSHSGENQRKAREKIILARMKKEGAMPGRSAPVEDQERNQKPKPVSPKRPAPPGDGQTPMILKIAKWGERVKGTVGEWFQESDTLEVGSAEKPVTKAVPAPQPKPLPAVPRLVAPKQHVSDTAPAQEKVAVEPASESPIPFPASEERRTENHTGASLAPSKGESQLVQKLVQLQKAWSD